MDIDWTNLDHVVSVARQLNRRTKTKDTVVYKHPQRDNYNIIHRSRTDIYDPLWVVWQE